MTADLNIHPATSGDAHRFLDHLRPQDDDLCRRKIGLSANEVAVAFVSISPVAFAAYDGGEPLALFGAVGNVAVPGSGTPWLLRTPKADKVPLTMAKVGRRYAEALAAPFVSLVDFPVKGDLVTRRWLKWLGLSEAKEVCGRIVMERKGGRHGA